MTVFFVGGLNELDKLPFRRTRDYRIDEFSPAKRPPKNEREQRVKRLIGNESRKHR